MPPEGHHIRKLGKFVADHPLWVPLNAENGLGFMLNGFNDTLFCDNCGMKSCAAGQNGLMMVGVGQKFPAKEAAKQTAFCCGDGMTIGFLSVYGVMDC